MSTIQERSNLEYNAYIIHLIFSMIRKVLFGLTTFATWLALSSTALAASGCEVNGQPVDCGPALNFLLPFIIGFQLIVLIICVIMVISLWKIFTKAGKPGWASIIPIYNLVVELEIIGRPIWWILLMFIPLVNIVIAIMLVNDLAKVFGKSTGFTFGLIFLPFIFYLILGFGKASYLGPVAAPALPPQRM